MLDERFRALKQTRPPDLWPDIEGREPRPPRREVPWGRLGTAALAMVVAAAGFAFAARAFFDGKSPRKPVEQPAGPVGNGLIAISARGSVYVLEEDGAGLRPLIQTSPGQVIYPWEWSPDGSRLALRGAVDDPSLTGGNYDIYVAEADGSGLRNLTTGASDLELVASQGDPTWSPDGRLLAFTDDGGQEVDTNVIQLVGVDGSGRRTITDPSSPAFTPDSSPHGIQAYSPNWSPDGTRIVFARYLKGGSEIYSVAPDGGGLDRLAEGDSWNGEPAWSPDGSRVAFTSNRTGSSEIFVMEADGSDVQPLTEMGAKNVGDPEWSPDGTHLIFEVLDEGDWDIWTVNADGTGQAPLTDDPGDEISPVWAPDGTGIAYMGSPIPSSERDNSGTFDVYVMDPDGAEVQRLTHDVQWGGGLAWQPTVSEASAPPTPEPTGNTEPFESGQKVSIQLGQEPVAIAAANDAVWVSTQSVQGPADPHLVRIEQSTSEIVARIPLDMPIWELTAAPGAVWGQGYVQTGDDELFRVDPASNEVVAAIPLDDYVGPLVADASGVWVMTTNEGADPEGGDDRRHLIRVDAASNQIVARIPIDGYIDEMALAEGSVWLMGWEAGTGGNERCGQVLRVDTTSHETEIIPADGLNLAAGPGAVWVSCRQDPEGTFVARWIDPVTSNVSEPIPLSGGYGPAGVEEGGAWFTGYDAHERVRVFYMDEDTFEVSGMVRLQDGYYTGAAFDPVTNTIWIAHTSDDGSAIRVDLAIPS